MEVKSFYKCQSSEDEIKSSSPVLFDKDTAISVAMQILREPHDFIGFIDQDENVLQFYYEQTGDIWVEHPSQTDKGSYGKLIHIDEVESLLISLPEQFSKTCIPDLKFQAW